MTPTLKTARFMLRPIVQADADAIVHGLNQPGVPEWLTLVPFPYTAADATDFIRDVITPNPGQHWAIDIGSGLIGVVGCRNTLGYWLNADHHGKGYMSEACTAVLTQRFCENDSDVISGYHLGNAASENVLTKLGFIKTHVQDETRIATGQPVATQKMVLSKARWMNR